nr:hypothetical protein [Tanacetum cinerariifolium]
GYGRYRYGAEIRDISHGRNVGYRAFHGAILGNSAQNGPVAAAEAGSIGETAEGIERRHDAARRGISQYVVVAHPAGEEGGGFLAELDVARAIFFASRKGGLHEARRPFAGGPKLLGQQGRIRGSLRLVVEAAVAVAG